MGTKTDTKSGFRICRGDVAFGVHLGVHSFARNGSATLYHSACPAIFGADNVRARRRIPRL